MSQKADFNYLVKLAAKEENFPELFKIIFSCNHGIDHQQMLNFLHAVVMREPDAPESLPESIDSLQNDKELFNNFLSALHAETSRKLKREAGYTQVPGKIYNEAMTPAIFWMMMAISMKKCLGTGHAKDVVPFSAPSPMNGDQKRAFKDSVDSFNLNADKFTLKDNKYLCVFLHKFHSKNKQARTRKKNLRRVTRRVEKMMQVYQLAHNNSQRSMFSNGRHEIPSKFDEFLTSKYFS